MVVLLITEYLIHLLVYVLRLYQRHILYYCFFTFKITHIFDNTENRVLGMFCHCPCSSSNKCCRDAVSLQLSLYYLVALNVHLKLHPLFLEVSLIVSNQVPHFTSTKKLVNIFPNIGPRHITGAFSSTKKAIDITFTP